MKNLIYAIGLLILPFILNAQLEVDQNNNVGIGITTPTAKLDVDGQVKIRGNKLIVGQNAAGADAHIEIGANRTTNGNAFFDLIGDKLAYPDFGGRLIRWGIAGFTRFDHRGTTQLQFRAKDAGQITLLTNSIERMRVDENGDVGIGTDAPTSLLSVDGSADKPGGGDWGMFSDSRLKKNIESFNDGLETLMQINPVRYQYNGRAGISDTEKFYVGIIAQELQDVTPYMVDRVEYQEVLQSGENETFKETKGEIEEYLRVDGTAIRYILINAVKELNNKLFEKESRTEQLEKEVKMLKEELNQLKNIISNK